eukprot:630930-Pelagomonas_calceolata.AAC.7
MARRLVGDALQAYIVSVLSCAGRLCSEMAAQAALETQKARSVRSAQQRGDLEALQLAINEGGSSTAGGWAQVLIVGAQGLQQRRQTTGSAVGHALLCRQMHFP